MSHLSQFLKPKFEGIDIPAAANACALNPAYLEKLIDNKDGYNEYGLWLSGADAVRLANYLGIGAREILAAQSEDQIVFAEKVFGVVEDPQAGETAHKTAVAAPKKKTTPSTGSKSSMHTTSRSNTKRSGQFTL